MMDGRRRWRSGAGWGLLVTLLTLASTCADPPFAISTLPVASLDILQGDSQTGIVGRELALAMRVRGRDANGDAVRGQSLSFHVVAGGGSVFAGSGTTNDSGLVAERWTLGTSTADSHVVEVRTVHPGTGAAQTLARLYAFADADVPVVVAVVGGNNQQVPRGTTAPDSLRVRVADQYDNPVPAVRVTWTVTGGAGALARDTTLTDADGVASNAWTVGGAPGGPNSATATMTGHAPVTFAAFATPGPPVTLSILGGNNQLVPRSAPAPVPLSVRVVDADARPVPGVTVDWAVTGGGGTLATPSSVSDTSGVATNTWTMGGAPGGAASATATMPSHAPVAFSAFATPGPPVTLSITEGNNQLVPRSTPAPESLRVRVADVDGRPVPGVMVDWVVTGGGGTLSTPSSISDTSGVAVNVWTMGGAPGGAASATATMTGHAPVVFSAYATPGPPATLVVTEGDGQAGVVGAALGDSIGVVVQDSAGRPILGIDLTWTVLGAGSVSTGMSVTTDTTRVAWTLGASGPDTLVATGAGLADTVVATATLAVTQISAGLVATCARLQDQRVFCWGLNWSGALGTPLPSDTCNVMNGTAPVSPCERLPREALSGLPLASVHVAPASESGPTGQGSRHHTCGLDAAGTAVCWGDATTGALGDTTGANPAMVPLLTFAQLSLGSSMTCGVTTGGDAWCWGTDRSRVGALGNGTFTLPDLCFSPTVEDCSLTPVMVVGGHGFVTLDAGWRFACAIATDTATYCWGRGFDGALGNGATADVATPTVVSGGHTFSQVAAGGRHACGLTAAGVAWCWGDNASGQLGDGNAPTTSLVPTMVAGGSLFASLTAGTTHTCGLTASGAAWCWGDNSTGALGLGDLADRNVPTLIAGHTFTSLSAGGDHTCGLKAPGSVWCWGLSTGGQLGRGAGGPANVTTPQPVLGPVD